MHSHIKIWFLCAVEVFFLCQSCYTGANLRKTHKGLSNLNNKNCHDAVKPLAVTVEILAYHGQMVPNGPKCHHCKITDQYIYKCPKVKAWTISPALLIWVQSLKSFSETKHMWTDRKEADSWTWLAPGKRGPWVPLAFDVFLTVLSGFPHFSPPMDGTGNREPGVFLRLHTEQFDLLCLLFCPSLKGKDVLTLLQDHTSLCSDNHETVWETEILSPCPLPPLEEKKMLHRAGFVHQSGWSQAWREFPFSGAVWCLNFWRLISKVRKAVLSEGGWQLLLCF